MRVIREDLSFDLQSSNRVLTLSNRGKGTFKVYPWMRRVLPKGQVGCPWGTQPQSSIIELSMRPVFDHREKGTLKVYPWLRRVLFKGYAGYPRETQPISLSISTYTVFEYHRKATFRVYPYICRVLPKGHFSCS